MNTRFTAWQYYVIILAALLPNYPTLGQSPSKNKPNIIVFLVDDMGWQDTSVPFWNKATDFNRRYHTPNMERLAREGMKFTNAYAMPVCTPTRVSLITGVNAAHTRVTHWTSPDKNKNTDYTDATLNAVDWNINGFSPVAGVEHTFHATALPEVLRQNGYYTVHSGKAHFGSEGTPGADPLNAGFDINIAGSSIGHPASYSGRANYDSPANGKPNRNAVPGLEAYHGTDTFLSDAITIEALKAIEKPVADNKPFFLYLAHYAVHVPLTADPRFLNKYLQAGLDSTEAKYAALLEGMDKSLGDVLRYLDEKKISDNTVVLFMSDNGGLSITPARGGKAWTHNLPLKAGKGSVYEGGIREPMLVKWPGVVKAGTVADQYVIVEDFYPTILDIAGIRNAKTVQKIDGKTFLPILKNPAFKDDKRGLVWHHPNRWIAAEGPNIHYSSAFRQGDWKLIYDYRQAKLELYNLRDDISEEHDLAASNPSKVKELATLLTRQLKAWNAQWPTFKTTGKPVPFPDELVAKQ
ncbi:arylsulfatase A-like enzyme [Dyadobacter sp. BE34]|nr:MULTISPECIES: sulfatase [Dyadobacter]MDR7042349.1 arylsulfatase A-like enzyme [Dyadobacter sp. BE242]MDR7201347.1 arylsulfatase A-like enzyme [Dyadobacter sp. BE34]MDR7215904.1 arylsulfatase A-like enzyme [Dyadobacter sp. BE31]